MTSLSGTAGSERNRGWGVILAIAFANTVAPACVTLTGGTAVRVTKAPPPPNRCAEAGAIKTTEDCTTHTGQLRILTPKAIEDCRHWATVALRDKAASEGAFTVVITSESRAKEKLSLEAMTYRCSDRSRAADRPEFKISEHTPKSHRQLKPGDHIRFQSRDLKQTNGDLTSISDHSLTYSSGWTSGTVLFNNIERLELGRPTRRYVGRGAAIGGVIAGVAGCVSLGGVGYALSGMEQPPEPSVFALGCALGGLMAGAVGAGIGALIGYGVRDEWWEPIELPAQPEPTEPEGQSAP